MSYINTLKRWVLSIFDVKRVIGIIYIPRYIKNYITYKSLVGSDLRLKNTYPCLTDWIEKTPFDAHYFYQAAWLSRQLSKQTLEQQHLDIGSDVRMIAVISAFIQTEFLDFRPLEVSLPNLLCTSGNILNIPKENESIQSLSCLHVIEHIGLGRYGDPLDITGSQKALIELNRILAKNGKLYLSVPVSNKDTTFFNAHRIFHPQTIIMALNDLNIVSFSLVTDQGTFIENATVEDAEKQHYGCGMFVFQKTFNNET